jgi:hypothetical protein
MDQAMPVAENASAIAHLGFDALGSKDYNFEISHTTLHQHLLAITFIILGETTISARILGVFCFIGVLFFIAQLSKQLFSGDKGIKIAGIATILYALNPFAIQYSLLVDQETTLLPLTLLIFFYLFFRQKFYFNYIAIAILSGAFALCLWGKEMSPYFALISLFPFLWLYRGIKEAILVTVQICLLGSVIFAVTWIFYCLKTGVPILSFVKFTILDKAFNPDYHKGRSIYGGLAKLALTTGRWVTPHLLLLMLVACISRAMQLIKNKFVFQPTDYLWFYIALYWSVTNLFMYNYPRYQYPLYSIAVVLIAQHLYSILKDVNRKQFIVSIILGLLFAIALTLLFEDPLLSISNVGNKKYLLIKYLLWMVILPLFSSIVILALTKVVVFSNKCFVMALLSCLIATNISLNIKQSRSYTTAVSWNEYGERGFVKTLDFLEANLDGSVPIIRKDLAYYLIINQPDDELRWIYTEIFRGKLIDPDKLDLIKKIISRKDVKYIVLDRYTNRSEASKIISPYFDMIHRNGDFDIYRKKII